MLKQKPKGILLVEITLLVFGSLLYVNSIYRYLAGSTHSIPFDVGISNFLQMLIMPTHGGILSILGYFDQITREQSVATSLEVQTISYFVSIIFGSIGFIAATRLHCNQKWGKTLSLMFMVCVIFLNIIFVAVMEQQKGEGSQMLQAIAMHPIILALVIVYYLIKYGISSLDKTH